MTSKQIPKYRGHALEDVNWWNNYLMNSPSVPVMLERHDRRMSLLKTSYYKYMRKGEKKKYLLELSNIAFAWIGRKCKTSRCTRFHLNKFSKMPFYPRLEKDMKQAGWI
jgi:hypothetical protein